MLLGVTGGEIVLFAVAAVFIVFALLASMVIPRSWPNFPGERTGWFVLATLVLFVAMLTAVVVATGAEEHAGEAAATETTQSTPTETTPTESTSTESTPTESTATESTETETTPTTTGGAGAGGDAAAGKAVFASAGCTGCHTLAAAGSNGNVGPNLDEAKPSMDKVVERVTEGKGVMPSFQGQLSDQQIQDVAAFVSQSTRGE